MKLATRLILPALMILLLAACGETATPAPTLDPSDPSTYFVDPDAPTATVAPTPTPIGTEDPAEAGVFDLITLVRSGGVEAETRTITVLGNTAFLVDGELAGAVDPQAVVDLDAQVDAMGFFRLDAMYGPAAPASGTGFTYEITVERGGASGSVITHDGYEPESLRALLDTLQSLTPVGPAPDPTLDPNQAPADDAG